MELFVCERCGGVFAENEIEQEFINDYIGYVDVCPYCSCPDFARTYDVNEEKF